MGIYVKHNLLNKIKVFIQIFNSNKGSSLNTFIIRYDLWHGIKLEND